CSMKTILRYALSLIFPITLLFNTHAIAQNTPQVMLDGKPASAAFSIDKKELNGVTIYSIKVGTPQYIKGDEPVGIYFNEPTAMTGGVVLWGYKWGIWSKPVKVSSAASMPGDKVQFFYW